MAWSLLPAPTQILLAASGLLSVTIAYTGTNAEFPTNMLYHLDWADGTPVDRGSLQVGFSPLVLVHKPRGHVYRTARLIVENGVSKFEQSAKVRLGFKSR